MDIKLLGKFAEAASAKIEIRDDFELAHGPIESSVFKQTPNPMRPLVDVAGPGTRR